MTNHLTPDLAHSLIQSGWRPIPGRCIVAIDHLPAKIGSIHTPESSRDLKITNICTTGTVLAINCKPHPKMPNDDWRDSCDASGFNEGDRVILNLYQEDLDKSIVITRNTIILAVIEE